MIKRYLFFLAMTVTLAACRPASDYIVISGYAQGGVYTVKLNHFGVNVPQEQIQTTIDSILSVVDSTFSGYNHSSILFRYNQGEEIDQTPMWVDLMSRAKAYREQTAGALDCFAAPLFDVWGFGFTGTGEPDPRIIKEAVEYTKGENKVNFNAIAQGYSCDLVAEYLHSIGVKDMLVDIGEIFCEGKNPNGKNWYIGVDCPRDGNNVPGEDIKAVMSTDGGPHGVVTSGNYRKFYIKDGKKYAHTIDPRTGYPVQHNLLSATVVAPTGIDADAYATYCMVIGLDEAKAFILSREDLEAYLIYDVDGEMYEWSSPGFNLLKEN